LSDLASKGYEDQAASEALPVVASVRDLISLLKPRVMSLVVFTGLVGLLLAPDSIHPVLAVVAVICIAVGAGASGAINMWYDRDIDAVMARTKSRPIPSGRIEPEVALGFGISLSLGSVMLMGLAVNWVAAGLLAFTIFFYIIIYTIVLKRRTPQNIVIGGASGAFPPMIGWAAVTGDISLASIILFAIIFLWTPPHFWALALYRCEDYEKANIPMLPVISGKKVTRWHIFLYTLALVPVTLAPNLIGLSGLIYGVSALFLGLIFVVLSIATLKESGVKNARRLFPFSILYLFLLFVFLIIDQVWSYSF
jgi:protoheme IX farnesyltransferase|tara:strand:- start:1320 stop:2246 length:927 start_codon:yes stop_codon:yes gene_type:complete